MHNLIKLLCEKLSRPSHLSLANVIIIHICLFNRTIWLYIKYIYANCVIALHICLAYPAHYYRGIRNCCTSQDLIVRRRHCHQSTRSTHAHTWSIYRALGIEVLWVSGVSCCVSSQLLYCCLLLLLITYLLHTSRFKAKCCIKYTVHRGLSFSWISVIVGQTSNEFRNINFNSLTVNF